MAKIKTLKKDIDFLTAAVVDDCVLGLAFSGKREEIFQIIDNVESYRCETKSKLKNHPAFENRKARKAYYRSIIMDTLKEVDANWSKLSEVIKASK